MQIKRYEAKDMTTALRSIKRELGPEAVILSARTLKRENKIFGVVKTVGVEVTAAIDTLHRPTALNPAVQPKAPGRYASQRPPGRFRKNTFKPSDSRTAKPLAHRHPSRTGGIDFRSPRKGIVADLFQHLMAQGVSPDIADDLVDAIKLPKPNPGRDSKSEIISKITEILEQKRAGVQPVPPPKYSPVVTVFIGPTGVGKTTTAATLAARYAVEQNKKVALISLDGDRIGAMETLKIYGRAIGIPVMSAETPADFKTVIHQYLQNYYILVDTPGFSLASFEELDNLKAFWEGIEGIRIHLLLSAATKENDLLTVLRHVELNAANDLIFTKLDESVTYGNIINVLVDTSLPLSFLTAGRQVPNTIENGTTQKMVDYLLSRFRISEAISDSHDQTDSNFKPSFNRGEVYFVANRNSDVFHSPDCKWTRKIKPKNMIRFANVQEARNRQFMPCRDCQPSSVDSSRTGLDTGEKSLISSYL